MTHQGKIDPGPGVFHELASCQGDAGALQRSIGAALRGRFYSKLGGFMGLGNYLGFSRTTAVVPDPTLEIPDYCGIKSARTFSARYTFYPR